MANKRISQLPIGTLSSNTILPIVTDGVTSQTTLTNVTDYVLNNISGGTELWSAGTGTNALVTVNGGNIANGDYSLAEGNTTFATGNASHSEGNGTIADGNYSHAEGNNTSALGESSHVEGQGTRATSIAAHAEGANTVADGDYSHAEGLSSSALGEGSHAEGNLTTANAAYSHAEGNQTSALGNNSHAEGFQTNASGTNSHAEGNQTSALGIYSHAEGNSTYASGNNTHTEGFATTATGNTSHAEGYNTKAYGDYSHAEGYQTTASGNRSHSEGFNTVASALYSHAEGNNTKASGTTSHAEGQQTTASGTYSHAEGYFTIASGNKSHAEGDNTIASGETSHAEGNFTTAGDFSHAEGNFTTAIGTQSHAEGLFTTAQGDSSHAEGNGTQANGQASHAEGSNSLANGQSSHAEGTGTIANGLHSHTEGNLTTANGLASHAEGIGTYSNGDYSHAEGSGTTASGIHSHAEGDLSVAFGLGSHAEGYFTHAEGDYSHAQGYVTFASGATAHAEGYFTTAGGNSAHSEGDATKAMGNASHAEGTDTRALGVSSHAEGNSTTALGHLTHAGGYNSIASGDYSFVHGSGSTANGLHSVVLGAGITGNTANTTYVNRFNIKTLPSGTSVNNLGIDSSGNIIIGSAGGSNPYTYSNTGLSTSAITINFTTNNIQKLTLTGNTNITFSGMVTGYPYRLITTITAETFNSAITFPSTYIFDRGINPYSFNVLPTIDTVFSSTTDNSIFSMTVQSGDSKILLGGSFTTYSGVSKSKIVRLNPNGTIDADFVIGTGFNDTVSAIVVQPDGKLLLGGSFTTYSGVSKNRIIRLTSGGTIDSTFNIGTGFNNTVSAIVVQPDGKMLVGGNFSTYSGITQNKLIRLNSDGTNDNTFNIGTGFNYSVNAIALQPDNKMIVGGGFNTFSGINNNLVVRLNSDGSNDSTFVTGFILLPESDYVNSIAIQPNGKIIFGCYSSIGAPIFRLENNGALDALFSSGSNFNNTVNKVLLFPNGKILATGYFTSYNGSPAAGIARINSDGTFDSTFKMGVGFANYAYNMAQQPDTKILIGGGFTAFSGVSTSRLIRLNNVDYPKVNIIDVVSDGTNIILK